MVQKYKRPPITEAVVEFRFKDSVDKPTLDKLQKRFLEDYPLPPVEVRNLNVTVQPSGGTVTSELQGYRLTAIDGAALVVISPQALSSSRLAPYQGWEPFVEAVRRNWEITKRICGSRAIERIGVRYINRIDVPSPEGAGVKIEDYLTIWPKFPEVGDKPLASYAMNLVLPIDLDLQLIINTGTAPNTLVNHLSFILDLDLSKANEIPQGDEPLFELLEQIRHHKNAIFESCITELSRTLFSS